ncbi:EpsI family protein [Tundrisphaera lichenicola]|uniref:EpsI family protein n=1 Tax=Tundrisphaera lichenicola TaxID=2029860 RepID=UPI003EBEC0DE
MNAIGRATLCLGLLTAGVGSQASLETLSRIDRPKLRRPLASLPMELGNWSGRDLPIDPDILERSQATECLSRLYENPSYPGIGLTLWVNYSLYGTNMRHSPEICLPSHGWNKVESLTSILPISNPDGSDLPVSRLAYARDELVQDVGFWYYIFGEGAAERWVRTLPITSRSSHGRTTRGSGLTVEVFWRAEGDPDSKAFRNFAQALLSGLDPILPTDREEYHVP